MAASLADKIKDRYGLEPELIPSGGGVFEVMVDGRLVFSKKQLNRFPAAEEIFASLDE